MEKRANFLPFFLVFFGFSLFLILLGTTGVINSLVSLVNRSTQPARNAISVLSLKSLQNQTIKDLTSENAKLRKENQKNTEIIAENKALKSQFEISGNSSQSLLPAKVIGAPGFVPGVSLPEYLIIDKGLRQGLKPGGAIVVENYLIGKVVNAYSDVAKVELIINKNSTFTGKIDIADGAPINGIVKGQNEEELIFDNVLLSANLKKDLIVSTKGDTDEKGQGFPPDLMVGKIITVEKKQSDLFQRALIKNPLDFRNLEYVFVLR